jgi:hypothetical protein
MGRLHWTWNSAISRQRLYINTLCGRNTGSLVTNADHLNVSYNLLWIYRKLDMKSLMSWRLCDLNKAPGKCITSQNAHKCNDWIRSPSSDLATYTDLLRVDLRMYINVSLNFPLKFTIGYNSLQRSIKLQVVLYLQVSTISIQFFNMIPDATAVPLSGVLQ